MKEKVKPRKIEFTKIDRVEFIGLLDEQLVGIQQAFADMAIAIGELQGHGALAKQLNERLIAADTVRNSTGHSLLDAAWRAASQRAALGSAFRTGAAPASRP